MIKRTGYLREYFGILIDQKGYVKIYAVSREEAINAFNKVYTYDETGNVYNAREFEYYKQCQFKNYVKVATINEDLRLQSLRKRGIV